MQYKDILLHLSDDGRIEEKTSFASDFAAQFKASLTVVYTLTPLLPLASGMEYIPAEYYQQQIEEARAAADRAKTIYAREAKRAGIAAQWVVSEQRPLDILPPLGRSCDLVIAGQPHPEVDLDRGVGVPLGALTLALGRPVLGFPYTGHYPVLPRTAVIAWNGSREAARAAHDALPLLQAAKSVVVLSINPSPEVAATGATLAGNLGHHGISARAKPVDLGDIEEGEMLLSTLADEGAELLVMGVYGHSRVREMILGGVSETILDSMTLPVLMSN